MSARRLLPAMRGFRRRQAGQAIPLGIAGVLFSTVLALTLFNTGQITTEKMRLTNAVDAAAYSGMVWEARALNFHAYTNRAMVANQVAIAQVVSWASWSRYIKVLGYNLNNTIGWIPFLKPYTETIYNGANTVNSAVEKIAPIAVRSMDALIALLSGVQNVVHKESAVTARLIVGEVVKANDPRYELSNLSEVFYGANAVKWTQFASQYGSSGRENRNDELRRQASIIMSARNKAPASPPPSRDRWARDRDWKNPSPATSAALKALAISVIGNPTAKADLVKDGETRLLERETDSGDLEWEWKAKDTLSLHFEWKEFKKFRIVRKRREVPLGWAGADASIRFGDLDNGYWSKNKRAERFIAKNYYFPGFDVEKTKEPITGYKGVRPYFEISDLSKTNKDPRLALAVEARKRGQFLRTSTKAGIGSPTAMDAPRNGLERGVFHVADRFAGDDISAVSKAEVYFRRPVQRSDKREEYGNLFNPYWDVRLVSARNERLAAWGAKGLLNVGTLFE